MQRNEGEVQLLDNAKYCSSHYKKVTTYCMNENCPNKRLVCLDCIKQNVHLAHQDNLIENIIDYFKNFNEETQQIASKISQIMNQLVDGLENNLEDFKEQFNFPLEMLNSLNSTNLSSCINDIPELKRKRKHFEDRFQQIINMFLVDMREISKDVFYDTSKYTTTSEQDNNTARQFYREGDFSANQRNYQDAIEKFNLALIHNPQHLNSLCSKGESLRMLAKYQESIECYDLILNINPSHTQSLNGKGTTLKMMGRFQDCIQLFDQVISINQNDIFALANKGDSLRQLNRFNDAIVILNQALQIDPNNYLSLCAKGACLVSQFHHAEAQTYLRRAQDIKQNSEYIQNLLQICQENILQQPH